MVVLHSRANSPHTARLVAAKGEEREVREIGRLDFWRENRQERKGSVFSPCPDPAQPTLSPLSTEKKKKEIESEVGTFGHIA